MGSVPYGVLVALHILLLVAWLGVDAGVFVGSHLIRNRAYDPGARYLVSRLMGLLDLGPRLSVPLTFAVGLHLAQLGGWASLASPVVALVWALALAWCAAILYTFTLQQTVETGRSLGDRQRAWLRAYRRFDLWARWVWLAAVLAGVGSGALGDAIFQGAWLNAKLLLFGLIILAGNVLRLLPGTSSMALMAEIAREGSTPQREDALFQRLSVTYPLILLVYACVVASVFLGVLKPG
jgi:hypothetical protein